MPTRELRRFYENNADDTDCVRVQAGYLRALERSRDEICRIHRAFYEAREEKTPHRQAKALRQAGPLDQKGRPMGWDTTEGEGHINIVAAYLRATGQSHGVAPTKTRSLRERCRDVPHSLGTL